MIQLLRPPDKLPRDRSRLVERMMMPSANKRPANIASITTYIYTPLAHSTTQFRIFTLLPSPKEDAPLEGTLRVEAFHARDGDTSPYEALSYVWGKQNRCSPSILVGGAKIRVTPDLATALRYIRRPTEPRDLWIDAVCIDQNNGLEKNHEVRQMYQTFASASRVIIWLGVADKDSEYALHHLEGIRTTSRQNFTRIATIFKRPWSSRMWTFQEALAANANSLVMCGSTTVPWQNVLRALRDLLDRARSYPDSSIHRLRYFLEVHTLHKTSQRLTLDKLIMATSDRRATNSRDYIYALLGLINDEMCEDIQPDYSQPAHVIFQKAIVSILRSHKSLDLIVHQILATRYRAYLHSWCISFTERVTLHSMGDHFLNRRFSIRYDGAANGRPMTRITHDVEKGTIKVSGTVVGAIIETSKMSASYCYKGEWEDRPLTPNGTPRRDHVFWERVYGFFIHIDNITSMAREQWERVSPYYADDKILAGHVWKLIANGRRMEYILNEIPQTDDLYEELRALQCAALDWHFETGRLYKILNMEPRDSFLETELHDACKKFADWLTAKGHESNSRFLDALFTIVKFGTEISVFRAPGGYVGSCHWDVTMGDVLCILFGCQVPLLLRKDDEGYYHIVGPVYVDGIMEGEFLASYRLTDFEIK